MNAKKAKALRKLVGCDLSKDSEDTAHGCVDVGNKLIGQIQPDGNHTERVAQVLEARTTENRFLYRKLKKIYDGSDKAPEVKKQLLEDLKRN